MSIDRITSTSYKNYCWIYSYLLRMPVLWNVVLGPADRTIWFTDSQSASVNHKGLWSTALWTIEANWWGVGGNRRQLFYKLPRLAGRTTVLVSQTPACCNCVIDWTATVSLGLRVGHKGGEGKGRGRSKREDAHSADCVALTTDSHQVIHEHHHYCQGSK